MDEIKKFDWTVGRLIGWRLVAMIGVLDNRRAARPVYSTARHSQCARHSVRKRRCVASARLVQIHVVGVENAREINM